MCKYPEGKFDRHPLSVPGPFYVEEGQCICCREPCHRAAELIGFFQEPPHLRGYSHCYVKQQPATRQQVGRMLDAMEASCCSGLRYCGNDAAILRRLRQAGLAGQCDELDELNEVPQSPSRSFLAGQDTALLPI